MLVSYLSPSALILMMVDASLQGSSFGFYYRVQGACTNFFLPLSSADVLPSLLDALPFNSVKPLACADVSPR